MEMQSHVMGGAIEEPCKCLEVTCGKTMTMQLMHNLSEFSNKQLIKMQVCLDATPSLNPSRQRLVLSSVLAQRCNHRHMC